MSREIKFRGKRIDNGEWVEGYYTKIPSPNIMFINNDSVIDCEEVIPETVSQFTGLKDKNGVEIYEGDILKLGYPVNYGFGGIHTKHIKTTIHFDSGCFWFSGDGYTDCNWHHYSDFEVIGNIHQKHEIL